MKNKSPREINNIAAVIMLVGVVFGFLGSIHEVVFSFAAGVTVIFAGLVFHIVFYRCPHCRKYLARSYGDYCPFCGEMLSRKD